MRVGVKGWQAEERAVVAVAVAVAVAAAVVLVAVVLVAVVVAATRNKIAELCQTEDFQEKH
jgi:hypothetical protein